MDTALIERRWLRFALFTSCYFAQGVPLGLLSRAVPPRLAELGFGVSDVALVGTVVAIPWAIKLVGGPFMDRFKFPAMGFRRPWVLAAQAGLTLSLVGLAFVPLSADASLVPLMAAGFLVNAFAATQDVAVDGMAIDVLQIDERGRANAFMGFGQAAGIAAFGALCGYLLSHWGLAAGAIACAAMLAGVFVFAALVRERPGERLLPWTEGQATERAETAKRGFRSIFADLMRVLFLPMSLLLVAVEFINRVRDGMEVAVFPVFAVEQLGYTTTEYTSFTGIVGMASALAGAMLGFVIDRHGAKRFLLVALVGSAACHLVAGSLPSLWENPDAVLVLAGLIYLFTQLIFVATIALFMNLCWPRIAATQFAIYMSLANLSRTTGSGAMAVVGDHLTFAQDLLIMGALLAISAGLLLLYNQSAHTARLAALEHPTGDASPTRHPRPSAA
ncbi:MAG: MFS transporter [Gammaproteobacteria bacterium]|nr:MFS transporter [Gammaproteobacteria bacterium]